MTAPNNKDTRTVPVNDFALDICKGQVPGHSTVNKFGRNTDCAAAATEEIWDGSAAYSWPATALMTSISQTADQAAMRGATIEVQGLDANWALVVQNAVLDATLTTNVVTLDTPLIRCFRMKVLANVVSDSPIRVHNAGETQDYAIISIGNNQTEMAIYTVPANRKAFLTNYYAHHNPTTGQTFTSNIINIWARDNANSYAKQVKHTVGVPEDGFFQHHFYPYQTYGEKTDIYITSSPVGAAADISAGFDLILVEDNYTY
jgi:hypothetical protein